MKKIFIITFLLNCFLFYSIAADCPCGDIGTAHHKRVAVKDRSMGNPYDAVNYTFSKVYKLKITHNQLKNINADGTLVLPNEKNIIKLTGYLRILKQSDDDCDLHMEISMNTNIIANRIIAEVPNTNEYCDLREEIFSNLKSLYNEDKQKMYRFGTTQTPELPKVTVYGYVFFDNGHPTGHNHGSQYVRTIWEVHPVFKVVWE